MFAIIVEPASIPRFFQFQLSIDGTIVGDREPCILGSATLQLGELPRLDYLPLHLDRDAASLIYKQIRADAELSELTLLPLAESMDEWDIRGYVSGAFAIVIAAANNKDSLIAGTRISQNELRRLVAALSEIIRA